MRDAGVYECQVNTEPKMNLAFMLKVEGFFSQSRARKKKLLELYLKRYFNYTYISAQATILGPEDVYVKKGSTISLTCEVNVRSNPPSSVSWHHGGAVVDFDSPRGGVSLETEKTDTGTTSRLLVTQARLTDSGNYTCIPSNANLASVMVHVLNGKRFLFSTGRTYPAAHHPSPRDVTGGGSGGGDRIFGYSGSALMTYRNGNV
ncbi:hypothetical protein X777_09284 [Ooceraea biroi]|uniref:Ig-like domain-containing protein n=1 Tax=Ooceraea biroi TaxID=2015173 RepID=A0A026WAB4_OOCBI|nr:hypothetical protein X777_09284 [Ooceraea biroi]